MAEKLELEDGKLGFTKITRVEIIDEKGRAYVARNLWVNLSLQDNGRTLKVFTKNKK